MIKNELDNLIRKKLIEKLIESNNLKTNDP